MDTLVTDAGIENEDYLVKTFAQFLDEASSDEGVDVTGTLYIDVNSIDSEDIYDALVSSLGDAAHYISLDESKVPAWFNDSLETLPDNLNDEKLSDAELAGLSSIAEMMNNDGSESEDEGDSIGKIITFGSAKGGSGKTFTSIITAYYCAKDQPDKKVCILDLDVEEPQMAIVINRINHATIKKYYASYMVGDTDFEYLKQCRYNDPNRFPANLDFYLTPREDTPISDADFWETLMMHLFMNYDYVILDTGTTYMQTPAIISAYKVADKICIVTMVNIASTITVTQQIDRLTGAHENAIYRPEDGLEPKINIIVTNGSPDDKISMNITSTIINELAQHAPVIAQFGSLSNQINRIEIMDQWNLFDEVEPFRRRIKDIYSV